jgi:hypothetical protein
MYEYEVLGWFWLNLPNKWLTTRAKTHCPGRKMQFGKNNETFVDYYVVVYCFVGGLKNWLNYSWLAMWNPWQDDKQIVKYVEIVPLRFERWWLAEGLFSATFFQNLTSLHLATLCHIIQRFELLSVLRNQHLSSAVAPAIFSFVSFVFFSFQELWSSLKRRSECIQKIVIA